MTDQPMTDERLADIEETSRQARTGPGFCDWKDTDELIAEVRRLRAEIVERLRTQLDDLRVIQDGYPCTARGTDAIEKFIKATMDEKWTQHAAPSSIPWRTIGDWLCELRDYRKALGEAPTSD